MEIERLYAEIAPRLTNYLVANGVAYASACDIVQETFLRIWKMRETLIDEVDQVSGLAYTIARNLRTDQFRKARREVLQDEIKDEDAGSIEPAASPGDGAALRLAGGLRTGRLPRHRRTGRDLRGSARQAV